VPAVFRHVLASQIVHPSRAFRPQAQVTIPTTATTQSAGGEASSRRLLPPGLYPGKPREEEHRRGGTLAWIRRRPTLEHHANMVDVLAATQLVGPPHRKCPLGHSILPLIYRLPTPGVKRRDFAGQEKLGSIVDGPFLVKANVAQTPINIGQEA